MHDILVSRRIDALYQCFLVYYIYLRKYFVIHIAAKLTAYSRRRLINEAYTFAFNFLFIVVIILYVCLYIIFI